MAPAAAAAAAAATAAVVSAAAAVSPVASAVIVASPPSPSPSPSPSPTSPATVGSLRRSFSSPKFTLGMGTPAATTSLSTTTASSSSSSSSSNTFQAVPEPTAHEVAPSHLISSALHSLGSLKRSGTSELSQNLHGSSSASNLANHFAHAFTASASSTRQPPPTTSAPTPSASSTTQNFTTDSPFSSSSSSQLPRQKAPSLDSDSNMSLDSDNDGSTDSDHAAVDHFVIPAHYHQYYSTDDFAGPDANSPALKNNSTSLDTASSTLEIDNMDTSESTSRPHSPIIFNSEDDTAVRAIPSRHVDYLSHDWREEDIWESWKYVVSRRREFSNSARLENASWRTWIKSKNKLKTISPETLNWLKESDVTWLYGPLQTGGNTNDGHASSNDPPSAASTTKPILKKRSKSEAMLHRSLSTSSLVQQATAAIQAQEIHLRRRPILQTTTSAHIFLGRRRRRRRRLSADNSPICPTSLISSGAMSPVTERKHIHFNEQVSQCIALDYKGDNDDDDDDDDDNDNDNDNDYHDDEMPSNSSLSDDEDGVFMYTRRTRRVPLLRRQSAPAPAPAATNSRPAIAMLPDTILKCEMDSPAPESAMKHTFHSPVMSPSSSQTTLRASTTLQHAKKSGKFFVEDSDYENEDETSSLRSRKKLVDDDDEIEIEQQEDISATGFVRGRGSTMAARGRTPAPSKKFSFDSDDENEEEEWVVQQPEPSSDAEYDAEYDDDDDDDDYDEPFTRSLNGGSSMGGGALGGSSNGGSGGSGGLKRSTSTSSLGDSSSGMRRTSSGILRTSSGMLAGKGSFFSSASSSGARRGF